MGRSLDDALREAVVGRPQFSIRPGPELGGEPGFDENGDRQIVPGETDGSPAPPRGTPQLGDQFPGEDEGGGPPPGRGGDGE
jgi:hypothetical protein